MASLQITNPFYDLIQGDVQEHLPLERISLEGDELELMRPFHPTAAATGTTASSGR